MEARREVHGLVPPVRDVRPLRATRHCNAVHEEPVPVIGRDVHDELCGARWQIEGAARVVAQHHEKWDGSGYPQGLAGEAIPVESRIVALADVFDALTARRPYKEPWSIEDTLAHLRAQAGKHFDPGMVEVFIAQLPRLLEIQARWKD